MFVFLPYVRVSTFDILYQRHLVVQADQRKKAMVRAAMAALSTISEQIQSQQFDAARKSLFVFLNNHSATLELLPVAVQRNIIIALLDPKARELNPDFRVFYALSLNDLPDAAAVKDALFQAIDKLEDKSLQINVLLQCLCRETDLGDIFYVKRDHGFFSSDPSITSGRLKVIAKKLNRIAASININDMTEDTKQALIRCSLTCPYIGNDLKDMYPALYHKIKEAVPAFGIFGVANRL